MKLGPLVEQVLLKQFPDKWITLCDMLELEYDTIGNAIHIDIGDLETISITKEGGINTSFNLPDDLLTKIIITELARQKGK